MKSQYPSLSPSELRYHVENRGVDSHFFDRKTMKYFGDTMKNFGCYQSIIMSDFDMIGTYHKQGVERDVYVLYRKKKTKSQSTVAGYFCCKTFKRVFKKKEQIMSKIQAALHHVRAKFPEVNQVFFGVDGQWLYVDEDFNSPDFGQENIDISILEDASKEAYNLKGFPCAFQFEE